MKGGAASLRLFASDDGLVGREITTQGKPWERTQKLVSDVWDNLYGEARGSIAIALGITEDNKRCLVLSRNQACALKVARTSNYSSSFSLLSPIVVSSKAALKKTFGQSENVKSAEYGFELLRVLSHLAHNPNDWKLYGLRSSPTASITIVTLCVRNWVLDTAKRRVGFQITVGTLGHEEHVTHNYQSKAHAALDNVATESCNVQYLPEAEGYVRLKGLMESSSVLFVALSSNKDIDDLLRDAAITSLSPWSKLRLEDFHMLARQSRDSASGPQRDYNRDDYRYARNGAESSMRGASLSNQRYPNSHSYSSHYRRSRSPSRQAGPRNRSPRRGSSPSGRRSRTPPAHQRPSSPPKPDSLQHQHTIVYFNDLYNASLNFVTSYSDDFTAWQPRCFRHYSDELFHEFCDMLNGPAFMQRQDLPAGQALRVRAPCESTSVKMPEPRPPLEDDDEDDLEPIDPRALAAQTQSISTSGPQNPYDDDDDDDDEYYPSSRPLGGYSANRLENEARRG